MIAVIDSGVANLESVMAALRRLDADAVVTSGAAAIVSASHVILPGVGAATPAMAQLRDKKLIDAIKQLTRPVLGICLGMQLLFQSSSEGGGTECLGVIPGAIDLLPAAKGTPVPHMGWNRLDLQQPDHILVRAVPQKSYAYFVHSFAAPVSNDTVATTDYGRNFAAMVAHNNFFGCQFHPERSGKVGAQILKNFLSM